MVPALLAAIWRAPLLKSGYEVRVLDSLIDQVHDRSGPRNPILGHTHLIEADVRDQSAVAAALKGVDKVIHLAAEVGVGQSMYAIERYVSVNDVGTAVLCQALIEHPVQRVVVASSMSIYGEGLYRTQAGEVLGDVKRPARAPNAVWDPTDADGEPLVPIATPEWKTPDLASVYALTKIHPGTPDPDRRPRLRHGGRGAAPVQRLRPRPGAIEPVYRRAGHFLPPACCTASALW